MQSNHPSFSAARLASHPLVWAWLLVLAGSAPVQAQTAAPLPDPTLEQRRALERQEQAQQRIDQQQRARQQETEQAAAAQQKAAQTNSHARLPENEAPCFVIQQVRFAGINGAAVPSALLSGLDTAMAQTKDPGSGATAADTPLGRCLGTQGINILLERAQNRLIQRGYITSRVLAAQQDLKPGILTLAVVPGHVSAIRAQPAGEGMRSASSAGLYTAIPTGPGRLLNLRDIEQGLENLKRAPTADADIQIAPAREVAGAAAPFGQSDLQVRYQQSRPIRLTASLDDSGTRNTGKYQGALILSLDNPLTLNDLFYVSVNRGLGGGKPDAPGSRGTDGHTLSYSIPFGYWSLGVSHSKSNYHQSVAGASQNYTYSGDSENAEISLSRLLYRDASRKTSLTLKGWGRASHNLIDDTEIEVQRRRAGGWAAVLNHREYIGKASLELNLGYKRGTGAFNARPAPEETFGEGTSRFALVTADATLNAPFTVGSQNLRYNGHWRWQHNRTPLTPQDRFAIGGRYTVRGFDGETSLMGERGWLLRNELGWNVAGSGQELYLGLDYGHVGGPSTQWQLGNALAGAVLGLRGSGRGFARGLSYDVFVGTPVHKPGGFRTNKTSAGFSLNWQY